MSPPVPATTTEHFGPRWGVYRRPRPTGRWSVVVHAGSEAAARKLMLALMDARLGHADWRVTRLPSEHDNVHEATQS